MLFSQQAIAMPIWAGKQVSSWEKVLLNQSQNALHQPSLKPVFQFLVDDRLVRETPSYNSINFRSLHL